MRLTYINWCSASNNWFITENNTTTLLSKWADQQPDLSSVTLQLSPANYTTHWVSMPGVKARMVSKAIPYALEEFMIGDVQDFTVVASGKELGKHRAYVIDSALIETLTDLLQLHHLELDGLVPLSACMESGHHISKFNEGWLVNIQGVFEGWVPDTALIAVLDGLSSTSLTSSLSLDKLTITADTRDQATLLKTNIETSFPEFCNVIEIQTEWPYSYSNVSLSKPNNKSLMVNKSAKWWSSAAALAAIWLILLTGGLIIDNQLLSQRVKEVRANSVGLYKDWFPGERIRYLERQFDEKLGGETNSSGGFVYTMKGIASVYRTPEIVKSIKFQSIRYSDRLDEITLEVTSDSMPALQKLKESLEKEGLSADIASATNDKGNVKGRIRVGGSV